MTKRNKKLSAILLAALMVLSVVSIAGVGLAAEVTRGGDSPQFNPAPGGPNIVVADQSKPVVFQGEENIEIQGPDGESIDASQLIGVAGDAEGIPLELPIPQDQELGQYTINGQPQEAGVTVQTPRVTDLEIFNERGIDVEGASVQEDEVLLVRGEWNFQQAEDLSLEVRDEDGNEVTGDVLIENVSQLSESQRNRLTGPYAANPQQVANPGVRGTGTGLEYLQGFGQFNESQLQGAESLEAGYWAIDLSDQPAGDFTVTVSGWDDLESDQAARTSTISVTSENDVSLDLETDDATRGENVRYTIRGSSAGATHYVAIESDDFRNNRVDERVFRDVENVVDRGVGGDGDFAWAEVEIDEDTGIGVGQLDTAYLDDTNVDVNLYSQDEGLDQITGNLGDTEDDMSLSVEEGELSISSPAGTYIAGDDTDVEGSAPEGVDDVVLYARDQGDWELMDINEDGNLDNGDSISVDADGTWNQDDVTLSQATDILSIPGRYRIGVIEIEDATDENGDLQTTLTTSQFSSGTSEQTSVIVEEPGLGADVAGPSSLAGPSAPAALGAGALQQDNGTNQTDGDDPEAIEEEGEWIFHTYNGQVATDDGNVDVLGTAPGLDDVLVVMIDTRGRVATERVSVDDNDVFEEDDISLTTSDGRELNEGEVRAYVFGVGRDTVAGDGVLPGQGQADLGALENYVQSLGDIGGLTQEQVVARIQDETVQEAGSDDLYIEQDFRYQDGQTSIESVVPQGAPERVSGVRPIQVGQTMVVEGMTNRKPDENTITVEVIDGPSAAEFDSESVDEWDRTGRWSANLSAENVQPGTYTVEVDDGDNTDTVQVRIVAQGQRGGNGGGNNGGGGNGGGGNGGNGGGNGGGQGNVAAGPQSDLAPVPLVN